MAITESARQDRTEASSFVIDVLFVRVLKLPSIWAAWQARKRYRDDLRRLLRVGPYMIADLGLALDKAHAEMAKPFWRT